MKKIILTLVTLFLALISPISVFAEDNISQQAQVVEVIGDTIKVRIKGEEGETVSAFYSASAGLTHNDPSIGDRVLLSPNVSLEPDSPPYIISDYSRTRPLIILTTIFVVVTLLVTRLWGVKSFLALLFSFYLIFQMLLPQIMAGQDPVTVAIITSIFIIPITFYLSHGINRKTNAAIIGTILALIVTGVLATIFVDLAHLSGLASEEAGFLFAFMGDTINVRGLLLAGIIIGTLGVLDDVTVSQSAVVSELALTDDKLTVKELITRAMRVGHDHISSMINTLVLVYTGASLPLLLLFLDSSQSFSSVINHELIAEEIVRTLVGSIGLILAVPLTTIIAAYMVKSKHI